MQRYGFLTFLILTLFISNAYGAEPSTLNPLHLLMRPSFPTHIATNAAAIDYILEPYDYRFITLSKDKAFLDEWGQKPLPTESHPERILTLESYLHELIGIENILVVDHMHKLLTIEPSDAKPLSTSQYSTLHAKE